MKLTPIAIKIVLLINCVLQIRENILGDMNKISESIIIYQSS